MSKQGYIALYRKIQDNFLWQKKRVFSMAEAWIDILMEVQHRFEPTEVCFGMTVLKCHYGQSLKSIGTWAKRWNWSESKVRRFFKMLENSDMIKRQSEGLTTRITVCNYSKYDPKHPDCDAQTKSKRRSSDGQTTGKCTTDNNDKNVKNEKKGKKTPSSVSDIDFEKRRFMTFDEIERQQCEEAYQIAMEQFKKDYGPKENKDDNS